jgi:hypothetical protein
MLQKKRTTVAVNRNHINEGKITLPSSLVKHLAMMTTGSARGVLFPNTKGTDFNKYL